jgi:hypothetical protein
MNRPDDQDELIRRYREASAQDPRRPSAQVREAVRAHAAMVHSTRPGASPAASTPAANQSRWKLSLLASIALAGLTGLLVLQFDRGAPDEQETALGRPAPAAAPTLPAAPPPDPAAADAVALVPREAAPARPPAPAPRTTGKAVAPGPEAAVPAPAAANRSAPVAAAEPAAVPPAPQAPALARERAADTARSEASEKALTKAVPPSARAAAAAPALRVPAPPQQQEGLSAAQPSRSPAALASALHEAARAGRLPELERLLQQGAALNAADEAGRTALTLAVIHGHGALVRRLMALGANPALVDRDGLDALQHARRAGRDDIVRIIEAGA